MHTDTINTIEKLENLGFEGGDADLETSLFEYGLAWHVGEAETTFIHPVSHGLENHFERTALANDTNVRDEYDWADFESLFSYIGGDNSGHPLPQQISDLVNYYGVENVFGTDYWEGFEILPETD